MESDMETLGPVKWAYIYIYRLYRDFTLVMENQIEQNIVNEMDTGVVDRAF